MEEGIVLNNIPESCFTYSFDDMVENNKTIQELRNNIYNIKNNVRSYAVTLGKHDKRVSELQDTINNLKSDTIEHADEIKMLKEECRALRVRTNLARSGIETLFEIIDGELRTIKIFSTTMCVLFFVMLVVNTIMLFVK